MRIPETYIRQIADVLYRRIETQVAAMPQDTITEETVTGITEDGRFIVAGQPLAVIGSGIPLIGQRVHVLWKDGRPRGILLQKIRRAQPGFGAEPALLEELILAKNAADKWDVWYRNSAGVFSVLGLSASIHDDCGTAGGALVWGMGGNHFLLVTFPTATQPGLGTYTSYKLHIFSIAEGQATRLGAAVVPALELPFIQHTTTTYPTEVERPAWWPYDVASAYPRLIVSAALTPSLDVIFTTPIRARYWYWRGSAPGTDLKSYSDYVIAVRVATPLSTPTASVVWTSPITERYRQVGTPWGTKDETEHRITGQGALVAWSDSTPSQRAWITQWTRRKAKLLVGTITYYIAPNQFPVPPDQITESVHFGDVEEELAAIMLERPDGETIIEAWVRVAGPFTLLRDFNPGAGPVWVTAMSVTVVPQTEVGGEMLLLREDLYAKSPPATPAVIIAGTARPGAVHGLTLSGLTPTSRSLYAASIKPSAGAWLTTWGHALRPVAGDLWIVVAEDSPYARGQGEAGVFGTLKGWPVQRGFLTSRAAGAITEDLAFTDAGTISPALAAAYPSAVPLPPDPADKVSRVAYRLRGTSGGVPQAWLG